MESSFQNRIFYGVAGLIKEHLKVITGQKSHGLTTVKRAAIKASSQTALQVTYTPPTIIPGFSEKLINGRRLFLRSQF